MRVIVQRKISSDFPLYIHDGFDPQYYAKFVGSRTDLGYIVQDTQYVLPSLSHN